MKVKFRKRDNQGVTQVCKAWKHEPSWGAGKRRYHTEKSTFFGWLLIVDCRLLISHNRMLILLDITDCAQVLIADCSLTGACFLIRFCRCLYSSQSWFSSGSSRPLSSCPDGVTSFKWDHDNLWWWECWKWWLYIWDSVDDNYDDDHDDNDDDNNDDDDEDDDDEKYDDDSDDDDDDDRLGHGEAQWFLWALPLQPSSCPFFFLCFLRLLPE